MLNVENLCAICAPIQNTNILTTVGDKIPENKGLECTKANSNIKCRFPNHGFSINFGLILVKNQKS